MVREVRTEEAADQVRYCDLNDSATRGVSVQWRGGKVLFWLGYSPTCTPEYSQEHFLEPISVRRRAWKGLRPRRRGASACAAGDATNQGLEPLGLSSQGAHQSAVRLA